MASPFTADGSRHMEYVRERGTCADLPLDEIVTALRAVYPPELEHVGSGGDTAFR